MRVPVTIALLLAFSGCPLLPPGELPSVPYYTLPGDVAELHQLADYAFHTSRRLPNLVRARTALRKADYIQHDNFDTQWRLARIDSVLAQVDDRNGDEWAFEGRRAAELAIRLRPRRVEGHLYAAICTALEAKFHPSDADKLTGKVIKYAEAADKIDGSFDDGGARRVLGAVYLYSPAWPRGVGELDEAIEVLEDLHKRHPKRAINVWFLAEAYRRADQQRDAIRLYKRLLKFKRRGQWGLEGRPYRSKAKAFIRQLTRAP